MFQPNLELSSEAKAYRTRLLIIFVLGLLLAFAKMTGQVTFTLNEVLAYMVLFCGSMYANFCMVVFYILLTLFSMMAYLIEMGKLAQQHIINGESPFVDMEPKRVVFHAILIATLVFDVAAIWVAFRAYKAFRYEAVKGMLGPSGYTEFTRQPTSEGDRAESRRPQEPRIFHGPGLRIGA